MLWNFSLLFTIHFATINTYEIENQRIQVAKFTIHFATINTNLAQVMTDFMSNLQYTLLLLIRC